MGIKDIHLARRMVRKGQAITWHSVPQPTLPHWWRPQDFWVWRTASLRDQEIRQDRASRKRPSRHGHGRQYHLCYHGLVESHQPVVFQQEVGGRKDRCLLPVEEQILQTWKVHRLKVNCSRVLDFSWLCDLRVFLLCWKTIPRGVLQV